MVALIASVWWYILFNYSLLPLWTRVIIFSWHSSWNFVLVTDVFFHCRRVVLKMRDLQASFYLYLWLTGCIVSGKVNILGIMRTSVGRTICKPDSPQCPVSDPVPSQCQQGRNRQVRAWSIFFAQLTVQTHCALLETKIWCWAYILNGLICIINIITLAGENGNLLNGVFFWIKLGPE